MNTGKDGWVRGDRRSLDVTCCCGEISKTATANEHRTIYLDCTS